jgi:glucokinase
MVNNNSLGSAKRWAVGVDLGATNLRVALVDSTGNILKLVKCKSASDPSDFQTNISLCAKLVGQILTCPETHDAPPSGIGLGLGFLVSQDGMVVRAGLSRHEPFVLIPFQQLLIAALKTDLPVKADNDSKAATWGEYCFGAGRGTKNMICLTVGTGIGGGIVVDGKLVHGADGLAGHIGWISVALHGQIHPSGVVGKLEDYVSGNIIAANARTLIQLGRGSKVLELAGGNLEAVTSDLVFDAAADGDALARRVIEDAGYALGIAITSLLHILNPEVVVIGGGVAERGADFLNSVRQTVATHSGVKYSATPILAAELGNRAGVVGAAAFMWPK